MKLIDFSPLWLTPDTFIFKNPTGGTRWLSCSRVGLTHGQQQTLFEAHNKTVDPKIVIVGMEDGYAWKFEGSDFAVLTVTPSIDASRSGNWHGYITNGEIK